MRSRQRARENFFFFFSGERERVKGGEREGERKSIPKSILQDNGKEICLLQSQLDQVDKDRGCLLAAVALLAGVLIPQLARQTNLVRASGGFVCVRQCARLRVRDCVFLMPPLGGGKLGARSLKKKTPS